MGTFDFVIWYLLQVVGVNGEETIMPDLIYFAAFVFALMSIGMVLTGIEFRKLQEEELNANNK